MKITVPYLLVLLFTILQFNSSAQQLNYTAKDREIIHDSINKSRWDIG